MIIGTERLTRNDQKRKMVEVIDTIIVKALQSYDKYSTLNPLEINLNSNYLSKIIHDYKGFTFEVRLINVLFISSLENDTQNIFIVCHNLNSAKKALINNKIYSLLGIIDLNEIKQWNEMKGKSLYVNAKIDDSHYMQNAKHFGFKFKSSFPTEFLEFTCEFLDDKADQIKFADGENKVPIIDLQIDILKYSKESVENLTRELKAILLKTKEELKNKDDFIKKAKTIQDLTKREYQNLYEVNSKLKKKIQQYETYMKSQQIEKRRREKNEFEKQKKELQRKKKEQDEDISVLNELKKT